MIEAGKQYRIKWPNGLVTKPFTVERVVDGVAIGTSGSFGGMGPFGMMFDAETGEGLDDYAGGQLIPSEGDAS